jgi:hypothetical protein
VTVRDLVLPEARDMAGPEALPRANGELVFDAPWEGRVLALAIELVRRLDLPWDRFRSQLISAIDADPDRPYYESWLGALEALVDEVAGLTLPPDVPGGRPRASAP